MALQISTIFFPIILPVTNDMVRSALFEVFSPVRLFQFQGRSFRTHINPSEDYQKVVGWKIVTQVWLRQPCEQTLLAASQPIAVVAKLLPLLLVTNRSEDIQFMPISSAVNQELSQV